MITLCLRPQKEKQSLESPRRLKAKISANVDVLRPLISLFREILLKMVMMEDTGLSERRFLTKKDDSFTSLWRRQVHKKHMNRPYLLIVFLLIGIVMLRSGGRSFNVEQSGTERTLLEYDSSTAFVKTIFLVLLVVDVVFCVSIRVYLFSSSLFLLCAYF